MKIAFVHFGDPPFRGSERVLLDMLVHLERRGHKTFVWCNQALHAARFAPHATLCEVQPFDQAVNGSSRRHRLRRTLQFGVSARRWLAVHQPDVVVCNGLAPCRWIAPAALSLRLPLLVYVHTRYLPRDRVLSLVYGASAIVGVSEYVLDWFRTDNMPSRRLHLVPNGVRDLGANRPPERRTVGNGSTFTFITVSALVDWKRVDMIVEAVRRLVDDGLVGVRLVIVGDGPERDSLERTAQGLPVVFAGWRDDVAELLAVADAYVSAATREAFGLSVIEAATLALPRIVPKLGAFPEVVTDEHDGLLVHPLSVDTLAGAMRRLHDNPRLAATLGTNGRRRFEEEFTDETAARRLEGLLIRHRNRLTWTQTLAQLGMLVRCTACAALGRLTKSNS